MRKGIGASLVAGALAAVVEIAIVAEAQTNVAEVVQERKNIGRTNGRALAAVQPILRNEQPWNQQTAIQAAALLRDNGARLPAVFPQGSGQQPGIETRALPAIWERRADFEAMARRLQQAGEELLAAAQADNEQAFRAGFPAVGPICNECHRMFRAPL